MTYYTVFLPHITFTEYLQAALVAKENHIFPLFFLGSPFASSCNLLISSSQGALLIKGQTLETIWILEIAEVTNKQEIDPG